MRLLLFFLLCTAFLPAKTSLTINGEEAELERAIVDCKLHGHFLIRDLTLTFRNPGRRVAEGDLTCQLDDGEEIVSFAMDVNGIKRQGVVVPAKRGRHAYETIVARGVDPGLIEVNEITNEFRTRVFPIPKQGIKKVWIRTVQIVSPGSVKLWPRSLGRPENWKLSVETKGGKAESFPHSQEGDSSSLPQDQLVWNPTPNLSYRSDYGDLQFVEKQARSYQAKSIEV